MNYNDDDKLYNYEQGDEDLHRSRTRSHHKSANSERIVRRLKKRALREKRRVILRGIFVFCVLAVIAVMIIGTGIGIGMYTAVSTEISKLNITELARDHHSYIMYTDENGAEHELEEIKSSLNREWVVSEEISDNFKMAAVAIEDQRFYSHHGVDLKRTFGATAKFVLSKLGVGDSSYGGSTITQQVIKNITNETDKSATRKIKEIMRALALEKQLTKDEILTMYLNIAFFANNCYGVEAASNKYFNKSADEVNIQEAAAIVGITQMPGKFDPYTKPENTIEKRNRVIGKMYELGMISKEEYDEAVESKLGVVEKKNSSSGSVSSYFVDQVYNDVINALLKEKNCSEEYAIQLMTNGGLKIYTTIDPEIQEKIEKVFENKSNFPSSSAQSAMVVIDPYTGNIKGMVGGVGKKTSVRGFNRATQAKRQPGSAIKPLSVYAPAIDLGHVDESTVIKDEQITIGHDDWEPSNSYSGFKGEMILRENVGRSANIPAVKVLDMIGLNKSYSYLENNFRLSLLKNDDKNYSSLALGGLTTGVTVDEIAAAYAVFVNGGKYYYPRTFTKVTDAYGEVILENKQESVQAVKPETAYIMSNLLSAPVNEDYGTARAAKLSDMPTYGKTGTTNDNFDKWFVGFTPYYVGAVWYGYDSPKSIGASSNPSTAVWKKVMQSIHEELEEKELEMPDEIVSAEICKRTGMLARSSCSSYEAYFENGNQPKKKCTGHKSGLSATATPSARPSALPEAEDEDEDEFDAPLQKPKDPPKKTHAPLQTETPDESTGASESNTADGVTSSDEKQEVINNQAVPEKTE